ncbi:tetratricopeptide repeat protein [Candidatus Riflebacteria bacterium]
MSQPKLLITLFLSLFVLSLCNARLEGLYVNFGKPKKIQKTVNLIASQGGYIDTEEGEHHKHGLKHKQFKCCDNRLMLHSHEHEYHHKDKHKHKHEHKHLSQTSPVSGGLVLLLQHLELNQVLANLLWVQMDIDSHRQYQHRVDFYLELIQSIDPHFVEAVLIRAFICDGRGQHREARKLLKQGIRDNPFRHEIPMQLGIMYFNKMKQHGSGRNFIKALQYFSHTLNIGGHPPYVERFYAYTLTAMEKRQKAVKFLKAVLKDPTRPDKQKELDKKAILRIATGEEF